MDASANAGNEQISSQKPSSARNPSTTAASTSSLPRSALEQAPCPHCQATGICRNGPHDDTCCDCRVRVSSWLQQRFGFRRSGAVQESSGCWCGVCFGKGRIEGATFKFLRFFPFLFAAAFVAGCLTLLWHQNISDKLQGALTTLMGTIVGFYFGGRRSDS